ncbi:hypothetical protein [Comamonas odontotermitis]|uniref:hypothetical protein n=1 Tax=Comamonas odontotermitis TaxID=379895 RepID=UPI003752A14F
MTTVRTQRQICAFIDVLGGAMLFKNKNRSRASAFFACLEEFERRLNGWSHHFPKGRQSTALVKTFSDNIFVAFPFGSSPKMSDSDVVHTFLHELKHQIHELTLYAGFPMRGAVSVGNLMFTDKFLYGPALVDAVQLEKSAIFPRILLAPSVLKYIELDSVAAGLAIQDADGKTFLHYLGGLDGIHALLKLHHDYVCQGLAHNASKIHERQKYEWLAQYHNYSARLARRFDLEINVERENAFSTRDMPLVL